MARKLVSLLLGLAAGLAVLTARTEAAPRISTKTTYFTVEGSTPGEVLNSILSRGPGGNSGVAMATTNASYSQRVEPRGKKGCRIELKVVITMRLPRLAKSSRAPAVRRVWGSFISYIRQHERYHRTIYTGCARRIDKKVRSAVRKHGCTASRAQVNTILQAENARCERLNRAYDQRERARIKRLPLIRRAAGSGPSGLPSIGGVVFGRHSKKSSRRLRPDRN
ncbi:MAG: DUF922 domain-containing protein [Pseudomonadota bacterium]